MLLHCTTRAIIIFALYIVSFNNKMLGYCVYRLLFHYIQYEAQLTRLRAEYSAQQDQICRDHAAVDRLEDLLSRSRQETMDAQACKQELQNEICRLKQKNSELQTKL